MDKVKGKHEPVDTREHEQNLTWRKPAHKTTVKLITENFNVIQEWRKNRAKTIQMG